jgi:large subunit ribosomal protein L13
MLGKSTLARRQLLKLKIYAGEEHPHAAQEPTELPRSALRRSALDKKN